MIKQRRGGKVVRALLLALVLVVFTLPLLWTLLASFGVLPDNNVTPPSWRFFPTFNNYLEVGIAEPTFIQEMVNSTLLAVIATLIATTTALFAAYGLSQTVKPQRVRVAQGFLVLASLPVMAYIIPLSDFVNHLRLFDTLGGVGLALAAVSAPFAVYVLQGYVNQVPREMEEAAFLEGASGLRILFEIVLPTIAPGLVATIVLVFALNWNLLLVPLMLGGPKLKTIPTAMVDFFTFERELEWPTAAAALIVSLVPLVLLVTLAQRVLERFTLAPTQADE